MTLNDTFSGRSKTALRMEQKNKHRFDRVADKLYVFTRMYIERFEMKNHKSFQEAQLELEPGINVVVGRNNSGKSTLLRAISGQNVYSPHRSLIDEDFQVEPEAFSSWSLCLSNDEFFEELKRMGEIKLACPTTWGFSKDPSGFEQFMGWLQLQGLCQNLDFTRQFNGGSIRVLPDNKPLLRVLQKEGEFSWVPHGDSVTGQVQSLRPPKFKFGDQPVRSGQNLSDDFTRKMMSSCLNRFYLFGPDRRIQASAEHSAGTDLLQDCTNLAPCLSTLCTNEPDTYEAFVRLVHSILEEITWVTPENYKHDNKNYVRLSLSLYGANRSRSRLRIDLEDCGSGFRQILAICYVVATAEEPKVILIDEPQSFLHPAASRNLIRVLERYRDKHQFVVSTHSPEIISASRNCTLHHVINEKGISTVNSLKSDDTKAAREMFGEIGFGLRDVFGFDRVLWVEGKTEQDSLTRIIEHFDPNAGPGLVVREVFSPSDADKHRADRLMHVYRSLVKYEGLLPPMVCILLDSEDRPEQMRSRLEKDSDGLIKFLPVPLIENYVLDHRAIHHLVQFELSKVQVEHRPEMPSAEAIQARLNELIEEAHTDRTLRKIEPEGDPILWIHGAEVLKRMLYGAPYNLVANKPAHFLVMCEYLLKNDEEKLRPLFVFLQGILTSARPSPG